jgi:hypothetical protein
MKIGTRILVGSLLLLSTQHSPAPIQESQETPSPSPTAQAAATSSAAPNATAATAPSKQEAARFAGTWTGRIKFGNAGEVQLTLIINPQATSLIHKSERFGETAHPTSVNAGTLSWTAGVKNGNIWTLTPNSDGQTAVVKVKPLIGEEGTATFQRAESPTKPGRAGARSKSRS